jgi:hypothetical protein
MKKIFLLLTVLLIVSATFQSCKKDISTEEAKAMISDADQDLTSLVNSIKNGDAATTLEKFFDFSKKKIAKDKGDENWVDDMFDQLDQVINFDQLENELDDGRFYFDNYIGLYTWNSGTNSWDKTSSDHIAFAFPSEENMTSNDILASIYSYTDAQGTIDGENIWIPTSLHADVKQNGTKLLGFDVNDISFDSNLYYFYTKVDVSLFVSPVTVSQLYDNRSALNFYYSFDVSDDSNAVGYTADLNIFNPFTENFSEQDLKDLSGDVTINNLDFRYFVNLEQIVDFEEEPTEAQMNAVVDVDVFVDDFKIGFLLVSNEEIYIEYNDGSRELFKDAFNGLINEINQFMDEYNIEDTKTYKKQKRQLIKFVLFKSGDFKNLKHFIKTEYNTLSK